MTDAARWIESLAGPVTFQGDAHGKLARLAKPGHPVIQVGDLGAGFVSPTAFREKVSKREDFRFIRGNHDDPAICRRDPRHLGDWGAAGGVFWVSGAFSIDRAWRVEGRDWWPDEELSAAQMRDAFDAYAEAKPRLVISHDGPACLFDGGPMAMMFYGPSATATLLQAMFERHRPEAWIFGHHHVSRDFMLKGTRFRCLAELETVTLEFHGDGTFSWPEP